MSCQAVVSWDFSSDGSIDFVINIQGCDNSSGSFEYEAEVEAGGHKVRITRRLTWGPTNGSNRETISDHVHVAPDETLSTVDVVTSTIDCHCI